jgi:glutathione S-transferase
VARAETRRLVDWFHRKFHDEVTSYLVEEKVYRRYGPGGGSPNTEAVRAGHENLRYHLAYLGHLAETRPWLAGEAPSFADLAAAAHLSTLDYLGEVFWEDYEPVKSWYALLKSRPSFRPLLADRVAGFIPSGSYADLDF